MKNSDSAITELFTAALEIDSVDRRIEFLDDACRENPKLRKQLDKLLAVQALADGYLSSPPPEFAAIQESGNESWHAGGLSVLRGFESQFDVPHVCLDVAATEMDEPVLHPRSPELPETPADSRYQLQGEIARGGMGAVFLGRDVDLGRKLAIKVLLYSHKDKPEVIQRFIEEAQIGGQLQHPGIAPVYELGQFADKRPFFTMKLVNGKTLAKLLADRSAPSEDQTRFLGIFEQVCQTIAYAHSRNVIHRDLKPSNIMVGAFGEVQVMDWGLAKVLQTGGIADETKATNRQKDVSLVETIRSGGSGTYDSAAVGSQTRAGSVMGTPAYMPPEQAQGETETLDERADVFGLGAILCEILTGHPPYIGDDATEVFRLASLAKLGPCFERLDTCEADSELVAMAKRCLELEPANRPRDAGELARQLANYQIGVQDRLKRTEIDKAKAQTRRKHLLAIATILFLVSVASGIAAIRFRDQSEENHKLATEARTAEIVASEDRDRALDAEQRASESARQARRLLYTADINLAHQSLNFNNLGRARRLLDRHRPREGQADLRGWEWRYLWKLTRSSALATLTKRQALCSSLAYSSDGDHLVVGWNGGEVQLWDIGQQQLSRTLVEGEESSAARVAYSPVEELVAATSGERQVSLYDLATGDDSVIWEGRLVDSKVHDLAFSRDGSRLVVYVAGRLISLAFVINVSTGQVESRHPTSGPNPSQFHGRARLSPDNKLLYVPHFAPGGRRYGIQCIDLETNANLWQTETVTDFGLTCLDVSPDGSLLASGSGFGDCTIRIWDSKTGNLLNQIHGHTGWVSEVAFSDDGRRLISSSTDQTIRTWDTTTWKQILVLRGNTDQINAVALDKSGQHVASGSRDGKLMLWDTDERNSPDGYVRLPESVRQVHSLDGSKLLLVNGRGDPPSIVDLSQSAIPVALSELGRSYDMLGSSGRLVFQWSAPGSILVHELLGEKWIQKSEIKLPSAKRPFGGMVYNDRRQLLAWIEGGRTQISWVSLDEPGAISTLSSDQPLSRASYLNEHLVFSTDGNYIAAYAQDNSARVWSLNTGQTVNFSEDGHQQVVGIRFAAGDRKLVALHRASRRRMRFYDLLNPGGPVTSVTWKGVSRTLDVAPDGEIVATSSYGGVIRLFNAVEGELTGTLHGHLTAAHGVGFSPDGRRLISSYGGMETLKLWDVETQQEMLTLPGDGYFLYVAKWSSDGNTLIAGPTPWQAWTAPSWKEIQATEN